MADDMDSDTCVEFKQRNLEIQHNHQEAVLGERQCQFSSSFSVITAKKEESRESSDTASTTRDEQDLMETSPKKKGKCSFHEFSSNMGDNQEMGIGHEVGFVSGAEQNQEMLDSVSEELLDRTYERKIENFGQEVIEIQNLDLSSVSEIANTVEEAVCSVLTDGGERGSVKDEGPLSGIQEREEPCVLSEKSEAIKDEKSMLQSEIGSVIESEHEENLASFENKETLIEEEKKCESFLEAEKRRLLAELEVGMILDDKNGCQEVPKIVLNDCEKIHSLKGSDVCVRRSLKIEVIDDTALIETIPVPKIRNRNLKEAKAESSAKDSERVHKKNGRKDFDAKKAKGSRRKEKEKHVKIVSGTPESYKDLMHIMELHNGGQKNGHPSKRMYSREELEILRFAEIVKQRKLWKDVYTGLGPTVRSAYDDLASSKHQKSIQLNIDPAQRIARKEEASHNFREECSETVATESDYEMESSNLVDPACDENITGKDAYMAVEDEHTEDDDSEEDYKSILRPAFLVEGEPDFDSGPPEDGFEYLRRVRWEAAQIPKVKVVKLDKSKNNKEQSAYMPQIPEIAKCPERLLPLKQWEDSFLADFSELRLALSHFDGSGASVSGNTQLISSSDDKDNVIVEKFINLNSDELQSSLSPEDSSPKSSTDQPNMVPENIEILPCHENPALKTSSGDSSSAYPTLSAIQKMDSVARVSMLRKHISLVESMNTLSKKDCVWLFALCAAVDTPLDADTCASLRSLLRKCASLRALKSEVDDEVIMLNILATVSGRYFGQLET